MKTRLPEQQITSVEEAKVFLTDLHSNGESYHPEDNAKDVVWSDQATAPCYDECERLNELMSQINALPGFDPCDFLLSLDSGLLDYDTEELRDELRRRGWVTSWSIEDVRIHLKELNEDLGKEVSLTDDQCMDVLEDVFGINADHSEGNEALRDHLLSNFLEVN